MRAIPLALIGLTLCAAGCGEATARQSPSLSFDIRAEYQRGLHAIEADELDGKTAWGRHAGLFADLVARTSREDRQILLRMILEDGPGVDPTDELLGSLRTVLLVALANDGDRDAPVRLLAGKPFLPLGATLTGWLQMLRMEGVLDKGVDVLFEAYDRATPVARDALEETLAQEFHFLAGGREADEQLVDWCRRWYAAYGALVTPNTDTWMSGPSDCADEPVLVPIRGWLEETLARWSIPSEQPPLIDLLASETATRIGWDATASLTDLPLWAEDLRGSPPSMLRVRVVEAPRSRPGEFSIWRVSCDLEVTWTMPGLGEQAADLTRAATFRALFARESAFGLFYAGEDWVIRETRPWGENGPAVRVLFMPGEQWTAQETAEHLGSIRYRDLFPGAQPSDTASVRVYPTITHLQFSVALSSSPTLTAWRCSPLSIKIAATDSTPPQVVRASLTSLTAAPRP